MEGKQSMTVIQQRNDRVGTAYLSIVMYIHGRWASAWTHIALKRKWSSYKQYCYTGCCCIVCLHTVPSSCCCTNLPYIDLWLELLSGSFCIAVNVGQSQFISFIVPPSFKDWLNISSSATLLYQRFWLSHWTGRFCIVWCGWKLEGNRRLWFYSVVELYTIYIIHVHYSEYTSCSPVLIHIRCRKFCTTDYSTSISWRHLL